MSRRMIIENNYVRVCQCDICQANDFKTCNGAMDFQSPCMPATETVWTNSDKENPIWCWWPK